MSGELVEGSDSAAGGGIVIAAREDDPGLRLVDPIERRRYDLSTPSRVVPEPVDPDQLAAPVDAAVRVTTSEVTLPQRELVYVRDEDGELVMHTFDRARSLDRGRYLVQITTPVKLYLGVEAPVRVTPTPRSTAVAFDGPTAVIVGARSPHRRPRGTITTTGALDEVRAAVSALGSALKTTSPERSYPTLRGHPPRIRLGDHWSRPDHLVAPETGVTIEVERSLQDLLAVAPLAFYLGAEVAWGDRRLRTDEGFVHSLGDGVGFETAVERTLKQTFLLDCLTRTEGLHRVTLDEREAFEARTGGGLEFARVYDAPLGERLARYLAVPYRTVADLVPDWSATTYVQPTVESVTALPYLLDTLSVIRTTGPRRLDDLPAPTLLDGETRSVETATRAAEPGAPLVLPDADGAVTEAWIGEGVPIGGAKALVPGFEHRLDREPRTGHIRIRVVCNERSMREELEAVRAIYGARRDHPFDVEVSPPLATGELREALREPTDLFHFIGHVDERGFRCPDGWLDAETGVDVGADVFLLNSCRSYEQGEALVRQGSIAGIVTVIDLLNHHAAAIGRTLGQFLYHGLPLYAALDVVRDTYQFGDGYTLLGDPHAVLFQPTTTIPEYLQLGPMAGDRHTVVHRTFPSHRAGMGTDCCLSYEPGDRHYLLGGELGTVELSEAELEAVLAEPTPLREGAELRFSVAGDDGSG